MLLGVLKPSGTIYKVHSKTITLERVHTTTHQRFCTSLVYEINTFDVSSTLRRSGGAGPPGDGANESGSARRMFLTLSHVVPPVWLTRVGFVVKLSRSREDGCLFVRHRGCVRQFIPSWFSPRCRPCAKRTSSWKQSGKQSWPKSGCAAFLRRVYRLAAGQCSFVFGFGRVYSPWSILSGFDCRSVLAP